MQILVLLKIAQEFNINLEMTNVFIAVFSHGWQLKFFQKHYKSIFLILILISFKNRKAV